MSDISDIEDELRTVAEADCSASWIAEALLEDVEQERMTTDATSTAVPSSP